MAEFEFTGRPLVELPGDTPVYQSVSELMDEALS
jgi:hypothetical protein